MFWWLLGSINAKCICCSFSFNSNLPALGFFAPLNSSHPSGLQPVSDQSNQLVVVGCRTKPSHCVPGTCNPCPSTYQQWEYLWHCWTQNPFSSWQTLSVFQALAESGGPCMFIAFLPFTTPVTLLIYRKSTKNSILELSSPKLFVKVCIQGEKTKMNPFPEWKANIPTL